MPIMPRLNSDEAGMAPMPRQRSRDRDVGGLGEGEDIGGGAGLDDAVAGEDERALGGIDQLGGLGELRGGRLVVRAVPGQLRRGGLPVELGNHLLRVLGDVDQHRAGAAARGDVERLADGAGDVAGRGDEVVVLGDRQRDAGDVRLLEGVGADRLASRPGR